MLQLMASAMDDRPQKKLSVVIPVFNVEKIIRRCLDALRWADEVNIVDMYSTDATRAICESYPNVRFYQNRGFIFENVNYGIERACHEWIMRLDSDEVVTPELAAEIQEVVLAEKHPGYSGYFVPSRVFFFGKWIKYGPAFDPRSLVPGEPYRRLLFRKGTAYYLCRREHEDLVATGQYEFLANHYLHYSYESISQWISKANYYTDREAEHVSVEKISLDSFNRIKLLYWLFHNFYGLYVRKYGYRDGFHGFVACLLHGFYPILEQLKLWEKKWKSVYASG